MTYSVFDGTLNLALSVLPWFIGIESLLSEVYGVMFTLISI